jgi:DNA/RNA-binding domain of Phe-tRNA-synthetase-like protein
MKFSIEGVSKKYPDINIGVLVGRSLKISKRYPELEKKKKTVLIAAADKIGSDPVTKNAFIASWRNLYRSFGTKPGDYRPSAEALVRRSLKNGCLPTINTAVDSYNSVSVKHLIPMGGFDADKVSGDIFLRFSPGGERFLPLGANEYEETYEGEVVYADNERILTRRWNYRDCDETKVTEETENVAMFIDGSPEIPVTSIEQALTDLEDSLRSHCGGQYSIKIADYENQLIDLGI